MERLMNLAEQNAAFAYSEKQEAKLKVAKAAVEAADRFFREAMPQMNVKQSALDANAIDAWNKAEIAIAKAMKFLS
jgi:enoyl-[acyl-carrier-protein] reductase (NADH)